ncbi:GNAT family N-acetyltransferase [Salinisphaera hydrothermalis]|uniref:N-acetyltransferase GCN5 n=1 Tax=Salinisphaera hydrothermalis (strain C41B8) TaxID=1304275 RepID=A0A084ILI0_SALHC|nr:GNAT family N-acetyltransferase [Salinisphaera hydrothermalis]KEZ77564.1 N-acetyltransferase GCN5 [Salinisphaera hydrothermalis C41B8]
MMTVMPDTLDTERLHLRRPEATDAAAIFAYASDPVATRYMIWPTAQDIDDTHDFLDDVAAGWADGDDFCYAIVERSNGDLCGAVSCQFNQHGAEIGYILAPEVWGRGLATEAAAVVVEAAWANDDLYRVWATCDIDNAASARVLEKLGMQCEGRLARWSPSPNLAHDPTPRDALCFALTR